MGGRRCASRRPLLKQKEWAWAAPLGLASPPLLAEPGGGGFGRKGKSGGGTELSLIPHSNLPFPHTRPDALKPRAQRGGTQRERLRVLFLCFVGEGGFVIVIIFLTLGVRRCGCVCGAHVVVPLSSPRQYSLILSGPAQQR